jgi:hypothetical protein
LARDAADNVDGSVAGCAAVDGAQHVAMKRATRRAEELWSMASFLFKLAKA